MPNEQPNLSKFCLKCNKFCDHWSSECPKGDMLDDWIKLSEGNALFNAMHRDCECG